MAEVATSQPLRLAMVAEAPAVHTRYCNDAAAVEVSLAADQTSEKLVEVIEVEVENVPAVGGDISRVMFEVLVP